MASLLKKTSGKAAEAAAAGWHPNFRNFAELPDTKVVRTSFFVNGVAIFVALGVILYFAYQEYNLWVLGGQIQEWEAKIEQQQKGSREAVALFKKFQEQQAYATEIDTFLKSENIVLTEFVTHLGATLPREIALTLVDYGVNGVTLRGIVNGEPDAASGITSAYERQLKEDPQFSKTFPSVSLTTLSRDPQSGRLSFEIAMRFSDAGGKK
jgi:hypothetical protein